MDSRSPLFNRPTTNPIDPLLERMNNMDIATKEKLRPYSSALLFAAYVAAALIWGLFFLGATDGMGYSLIIFYLLTPILASVSTFHLALKTNWKIAGAALLLYAAANNLMQLIVFHNRFHISAIHIALVLIPGAVSLLLGMVKASDRPSENRRAWLWPCILFFACALVLFVCAAIPQSGSEPFIGFFFVLPLLSFVCSLCVAMEEKLTACGISLLFYVAVSQVFSYLLWPESSSLTAPFTLIVGFAGMAVGWALKKHAVSRKKEQ